MGELVMRCTNPKEIPSISVKIICSALALILVISGIIHLCHFPQALNFEIKKSYTLKVEAGNTHVDPRFISKGPFKDTAAVKITVDDADEPPVFSLPNYFLEVRENAAFGSLIGEVLARDPDVSDSSVR